MWLPIVVPSLAERIVDIPDIVKFMLTELKKDGENIPKSNQSAYQELGRYNWPGNIRELRNVVERATVLLPLNQEIPRANMFEKILLKLKVPRPSNPEGCCSGMQLRTYLLKILEKKIL